MEHLVIEHDVAVAVFRLNRPPVNAIDLTFARELETAFATLVDAGRARAIVFTGTGDCFSAGLDLKRVPRYRPEEQREMVSALNRTLATLYACPVPVVGAVNGHAIAGGLIFAHGHRSGARPGKHAARGLCADQAPVARKDHSVHRGYARTRK